MRIEFKADSYRALGARMTSGSSTAVRIALNNGLRKMGQLLVPALKAATPVREGTLKNSTVFQVVGGPRKQVLAVRQDARTASGAFYGRFVREGTRAHTIRPVRAKALRFIMGGQEVFAVSVKHPGTKANPYHIRTLRKVKPQMEAIASEMGGDVIAFVTGGS